MSGAVKKVLNRWRTIAVYLPLVLGFFILLYLRSQGELEGGGAVSIAFSLMACSCLIYSVLPGVGQISPEQMAMLSQLRIEYRPWMGRVGNALIGFILLGIAVTIYVN